MAYEILKHERCHTVKGVLFDMDGLVLDTEILYTRFWMEAARQLGYPMTWEQSLGMRSLNKVHGQQYLEKCFGKGISHAQVRALRIELMDAWINEHGVEAKPGIHELLEYLHSNNIPCAITTSSPLYRVENYLKPLGLYDKFDVLCSGYEVKNGKPEPDIYLYGASKIKTDPSDCLALEDSPAGIESAFRAGCISVVIPDQDQPSNEILKRCFARADSLEDISSLIRTLNE